MHVRTYMYYLTAVGLYAFNIQTEPRCTRAREKIDSNEKFIDEINSFRGVFSRKKIRTENYLCSLIV